MLLVLACSIHRSSVFSRSRAVGVRSGSITYTAGQKDHAPRQNPSYQTPHMSFYVFERWLYLIEKHRTSISGPGFLSTVISPGPPSLFLHSCASFDIEPLQGNWISGTSDLRMRCTQYVRQQATFLLYLWSGEKSRFGVLKCASGKTLSVSV